MDKCKPPPHYSFDNEDTNLWWKWEKQFREYHKNAELSKTPPETQAAILLHCLGPEAQEIYNNFIFANDSNDDDDNWEHILKKFKLRCESQKNVVFKRFKFWQRDQRSDETFDEWYTELQNLISACAYGHQADLCLRDRIVCGVADNDLQQDLLSYADLTLQETIELCHAAGSRNLPGGKVKFKQSAKGKRKDKYCNEDDRSIDEILSYIEGTTGNEKKQAKRARQKQRREEEKRRQEAKRAMPTEPFSSPDKSKKKDKNKKQDSLTSDGNKLTFVDKVFLPRNDISTGELDSLEREIESFKRFCLDSSTLIKQRKKLVIDWKNCKK